MGRGGQLGSPCSRAAGAQAGRVIVVPQTVSPGVEQLLVVSGATLLESVYDALQEDPANLQVRDARNGGGGAAWLHAQPASLVATIGCCRGAIRRNCRVGPSRNAPGASGSLDVL